MSVACPKEQWREGTSWETLESFLIKEDLLEERGGSKVWELRLWCCSSSGSCKRGFVTEGSASGVCLLVSDVERKELLSLDNEGVPKNPMFGDGTLLYRSIDCLKHNINNNNISIQFNIGHVLLTMSSTSGMFWFLLKPRLIRKRFLTISTFTLKKAKSPFKNVMKKEEKKRQLKN